MSLLSLFRDPQRRAHAIERRAAPRDRHQQRRGRGARRGRHPLIRGIAVLRRLTDADGVSSLSGLERSTGLARSTVDRITATLARRGYVRLDGRDAVLAPV